MSHLDIAKEVLRFEASQIERIAGNLSSDFNKAADHILQHNGKLIVCGIGKSGSIAQKITATFCSTGTQAVFLHAAEALHGDLGIYADGDPVLLLSKSGTTAEILRLIPFFKEHGSKIICITGNMQGPIAAASDHVLNASVEREADAFDLAPTASSTVALALGDALAIALMEARGFTQHDFAKFHPGGQLGKNLLLKVKDVMHPLQEIATVQEGASFRELIIALTKYNLGAACILDTDNKLCGIITDGDVRRSLLRDTAIENIQLTDILTKDPVVISPQAYLKEAVELMENRSSQLSVLPVVDDGKCAGLIRIHDIYQT